MKVIVAGYSKTGTKTLNAALTLLGYNVYDFIENFYYLHKDWNRIFDKGVQPGDFERMYKGVDAVMDLPCYYYWKELAEAFPEAKIILMLRDEDSWYKSTMNQYDEMNANWLIWAFETFTISGLTRKRYRYNIFKLQSDVKSWPRTKVVAFNENTLKRLYRQHNLEVKETAPKDRLLVFNVSDGWKPLCQFLGVEIPDKPFPHKNVRGKIFEDFRKNNEVVIKTEREFKITFLVLAGVLATASYRLYKYAVG